MYRSIHITCLKLKFIVLQEVVRIKNEHPDDNRCIVNDRVKGRLKVTRAFGAGFLKQVPFKIIYCNITSLLLFTSLCCIREDE